MQERSRTLIGLLAILAVGVVVAASPLLRSSDPLVSARDSQSGMPVVIRDVNVVAMTTREILYRQTVVVRDRRIAAIGPTATIAMPSDAVVVDGSRHYLVPGLVDAHVHLQDRADENRALLRLFLANGVTTVLNLLGTPAHLRLREQVARGAELGPRIFTSGPSVGTPHGRDPDATPEEMIDAVIAQKRAGYDFVKLHGDLSAESYRALLREAGSQGIPIVGHAPRNLGVRVMIEERQPAVAHVEEYLYGALFYRRPQRHPLPGADETIASLAADTKRAGTAVISTLDVYRRIATQVEDPVRELSRPEVRCLPRALGDRLGWWLPHNTYVQRFDRSSVPLFRANYALLAQLTMAFQRAAVPVLAGTDTPTAVVVPGFSVHDELRDLVAAGFTPYEALQAATVNSARLLRSDSVGTLGVGTRADAVLLDGNPLQDITQTTRIAGVLLNGRWLNRETLKMLVREVVPDCPLAGGALSAADPAATASSHRSSSLHPRSAPRH